MVNPANCPDREQLETLYQHSAAPSFRRRTLSSIQTALKSVSVAIFEALTCDRTEPIIRRRINYDGTPIWSVYDPVTRQTFVATSQNEIRAWLEQRYYQQ